MNSPYHEWGDDWPHWKTLYKAENDVCRVVRRFTGCYVFSKEKYGTIRWEGVYPPFWAQRLKIYQYWRLLGEWFLVKTVKRYARLYPEISDELLDDLDW